MAIFDNEALYVAQNFLDSVRTPIMSYNYKDDDLNVFLNWYQELIKYFGGSGGGDTIVVDDLTSNSTTSALSANQGRILNNTKADSNNVYTKTEIDQKFDDIGGGGNESDPIFTQWKNSTAIVLGFNASINGNNAIAIGNNASSGQLSSNNTIAIGNGSAVGVNSNNSIAIGNSSNVTNAGSSVAIGNGSICQNSDTVAGEGYGVFSVGSSNNISIRRRIINVRPGILDSDSATVSQLNVVKIQNVAGENSVTIPVGARIYSVVYNNLFLTNSQYDNQGDAIVITDTGITTDFDDTDIIEVTYSL